MDILKRLSLIGDFDKMVMKYMFAAVLAVIGLVSGDLVIMLACLGGAFYIASR